MSITTQKFLLFTVVILVALNTATIAAWISVTTTGGSVPMALRDFGIAFGATLTLGILVMQRFGLLKSPPDTLPLNRPPL